jgi:hypothetical protein
MDWVAGFTWIEWQPSHGLGGRHPWNMQVKALPGYDGVPVIVTSGVDAEANVKEACRLGVLAFIVKPLTSEKFWPVIQELKKLHIGLMVEVA